MDSHPTPPPRVEKMVHLAFFLRGFLLRHFSLPRFSRKTEFSDTDPRTGRYYHYEYLVHPYYVRPTLGNRWGPQAWLTWALGGIVPGGGDGSRYMPAGYRFEEVGPDSRTPFGKEKLEEWQGKVEKTIPGKLRIGNMFVRSAVTSRLGRSVGVVATRNVHVCRGPETGGFVWGFGKTALAEQPFQGNAEHFAIYFISV
ncbi:hypothetical protein E4U53_007420 [Claviceps sorghi]|nr:hypothetical protein E4U53_007420 [Claviceps sorghi]